MNPNRELLTALLDAHVAQDALEQEHLGMMRDAVRSLDAPFSRTQERAHFTGSAVIVDPAGERICLVHHAKLHRWLQPGGHCEPQDGGSLEATALREAAEETGLKVKLHPGAPRPLDVDAHVIPARKTEGQHHHLDIRYLLIAEEPEALAHDPNESHGAKWLTWDEALASADEPALKRMFEKARAVCQPGPFGRLSGRVAVRG